jgi:outer membrane translocation and assembly module TamA
VDVGNAFNSFQNQQDYGQLPFGSALQAMAIAAGVGLRYDTPAGPLRVDVAVRVHDPARARPWLFAQPFDVANDVRVQIGLGHAF